MEIQNFNARVLLEEAIRLKADAMSKEYQFFVGLHFLNEQMDTKNANEVLKLFVDQWDSEPEEIPAIDDYVTLIGCRNNYKVHELVSQFRTWNVEGLISVYSRTHEYPEDIRIKDMNLSIDRQFIGKPIDWDPHDGEDSSEYDDRAYVHDPDMGAKG